MLLKDKVAVITGGAGLNGLGFATARMMSKQGALVVILDLEQANPQLAAAQLGDQHLGLVADVTDKASCEVAVARIQEKYGRIDILVNNAGITRFCEHDNLEGLSAADFQSIYAVNLVGPFQMIRAVAPAMQQLPEGGVVVNVASTAALTGIGSSVAYAASKGALVTMTLSLARALGPALRINAVCPGFIQGDWLRNGLGEEKYEAARLHNERNAPLGVTADAETVADAILFFITGPQIVTGETLIVDGGRHLNTVPLGRR